MRISGARNALGRLPGGRHRPRGKAQQAALAGEFRSDFSGYLERGAAGWISRAG